VWLQIPQINRDILWLLSHLVMRNEKLFVEVLNYLSFWVWLNQVFNLEFESRPRNAELDSMAIKFLNAVIKNEHKVQDSNILILSIEVCEKFLLWKEDGFELDEPSKVRSLEVLAEVAQRDESFSQTHIFNRQIMSLATLFLHNTPHKVLLRALRLIGAIAISDDDDELLKAVQRDDIFTELYNLPFINSLLQKLNAGYSVSQNDLNLTKELLWCVSNLAASN